MLNHFTRNKSKAESSGISNRQAFASGFIRWNTWQKMTLLSFAVVFMSVFSSAWAQSPDVVAMFKFDGNLTDETGNLTATPSNLTYGADRFGNAGKALKFDGVSSFLNAGTTFAGTGTFSVSLWFKRTNADQAGTLIAKYADPNCSEDQRQFRLQVASNDKIEFYLYHTTTAGNTTTVSSSNTVNDTNWHHLSLSYRYDAAILPGIDMYIDGVAQTEVITSGQGTKSEIDAGTAPLGFGALVNTAGNLCATTLMHAGYMDDVVIFNRSLSSTEHAALYSNDELLFLSLSTYELSFPLGFSPQLIQAYVTPTESGYTYSVSPNADFVTFNVNASTGEITMSPVGVLEGEQVFTVTATKGDTTLTKDFHVKVSSLITKISFDDNTIQSEPQAFLVNTNSIGAPDRFGRANFARYFNGAYHATGTYSGTINVIDKMSFSGWVYPQNNLTASSPENIFFQVNQTFAIGYNAGNLRIYTYDNTGTQYLAEFATTLYAQKWYHIVVNAEAGQALKLYINGEEFTLGNAPATFYQKQNPTVTVGKNNILTAPFAGYMDDIFLYSKLLGEQERKALGRRGSPNFNLTQNLLQYLPFDGSLVDLTPVANNPTFNGTLIYNPARFASPDSSVLFNGSTYLSVAAAQAADLEVPINYTYSMWIKTSNTNYQYIASKGSGNVRFILAMNADGSVSATANYAIYVGGGCPCYSSTITSSHTNLNDDQWHHVVFTRNGRNTYIYVDNQFSAYKDDIYSQYMLNNSQEFFYGRYGGNTSSYFLGELDEYRFYNRYITPEEIDVIYKLKPAQSNNAPTFTASVSPITLVEDSQQYNFAALDTMFTDADGNVMKYSASSSDANLFTVSVSADLVVSILPVGNAFGQGELILTATDITDTTEYRIPVNINPVNDVPVFHFSNNLVKLTPNAAAQVLQVVSDQPANESGQALVYTIDADNSDVFDFTINQNTGEITIAPGSNPQADTLDVVVSVNDGEIENNFYQQTIQLIMYSSNYEGLIAHYKFNGNAQNNSPITVGNHDGTVTAAVLANDRMNNANSAYYFDGAGDHITLNNSNDFNFDTDKDYSISLWMRAPYSNTNRMLVDKGNNPRYYLALNSEGLLIGVIAFGGNNYETVYSTKRYDNNRWYHVALTVDRDSVMNLYVDGELVGSETLDLVGTVSTAYGMRFGALSDNGASWNYLGYMDDIRIYNRLIDVNQIASESDENRPTYLEVTSISPKRNSVMAANDSVVIAFNQVVDAASLSGISVKGNISGNIAVDRYVEGNSIVIKPVSEYKVGELVTFILPKSVVGVSGDTLFAHAVQFENMIKGIRAHETPMQFYSSVVVDDVVTGNYVALPADMDADGDVDILAMSQGENKLVVYVNDGVANFTETAVTAPGGIWYDLKAADLNSDGLPDIVMQAGNSTVWLKNNGSLSFDGAVAIATLGAAEFKLNPTDIDADGDLDVLVYTRSSQGGHTFAIRNNNHGTSFTLSPRISILDIYGAGYVYGTVAGDVNNDGLTDIFQIQQTNIYQQNINPGFSGTSYSSLFYSFPYNGTWTNGYGDFGDLADIDNDGDNDLIVSTWASNSDRSKILLFENLNGIISTNPLTLADLGLGANINGLVVVALDLDGDGDKDLVIQGGSIGTKWLENLGNKYFAAPSTISSTHNLLTYKHYVPSVADFDGDGYTDLLVGGAGNFTIFSSKDALTLLSTSPAINAVGVDSTTTISFTFDNPLDVNQGVTADNFYIDGSYSGRIAANNITLSNNNTTVTFSMAEMPYAGEKITVSAKNLYDTNQNMSQGYTFSFYIKNNAGTGQFVEAYSYANNMGSKLVAASEKVNGGLIDFYGYASYYSHTVYQFENTGKFEFTRTDLDNISGNAAASFVMADLNADGVDEYMFNDGYGNRIYTSSAIHNISIPSDYAVADMNGDGYLDVVVRSNVNSFISFHNNGSGGFTQASTYHETLVTVNSFKVADINSDGWNDIIYGAGTSCKIIMNDKGTFGRVVTLFTTPNSVVNFETLDPDADGDIDIVTAHAANAGLLFWENTGNLVFAQSVNIASNLSSATRVKAFDLDGDNMQDLMVQTAGTVLWLRNNGDGFESYQSLGIAYNNVTDFDVADFDNDKDLDFVIASSTHFVVYSNGPLPNGIPTVVSTPADAVMTEDGETAILVSNVAALFSDPDADELTYYVAADTSAVDVYFADTKDGKSVMVNLAANYFGSSVIEIKAKDWQDSVSTSFVLDVTGVNDAPTFEVSFSSLNLDEDFEAKVFNIVNTQPENESDQMLTYQLDSNIDFVNISVQGTQIFIDSVPNAFGSGSFTITTLDAQNADSAYTLTFDITVNPIEDSPVFALSGDITVDEDAFELDTVFANISHPENEEQTLNFTLSPASVDFANLVLDSVNGNVYLSVIENGFGTQLFTLSVSDGVNSVDTSFTLTVNAVNDIPEFELSQSVVNIGKNFANPVVVTASGFSPANESDQNIAYSIDPASVAFADVQFDTSTGTLTIHSIQDQVGVQTFTITADDGQATDNLFSATFELNVLENQPPVVANSISDVSMDEDALALVVVSDVSTVFTDPENDQLTFSVLSSNASVVATLNGNSLEITPAADFYGISTITLRANDGNSFTDEVFVVTVNAVNDAPVGSTASVDESATEDAAFTSATDFNTLFSDVDGDPLTLTLVEKFPMEVAEAWYSFSNGIFTANPLQANVGVNQFYVIASDGIVSDTITFNLTVNNVNDRPYSLQSIQAISLNEDDAAFVYIQDLNTYFADEDGDMLSYLAQSSELNITANIVGNSLSLSLAADYNGSGYVTVTASDGNLSFPQTFFVEVFSVNDAPAFTLSRAEVTVPMNFTETETIGVTTLPVPADEVNQVVTYSISPSTGTFANVVIDSNTGEISITAIPDVFGTEMFTVTANDAEGINNTYSQSFSLTVQRNNDAPTDILLDNDQVSENMPIGSFITLLGTVDANEDVASFELVSGEGSDDNALFGVFFAGGTKKSTQTTSQFGLYTNAVFDFETKNSYKVRLRADDGFGGVFEKAVEIFVSDVNEMPSDVVLSSDTIQEGKSVGTVIGTFSTIDVDANDTHTYMLSPGETPNDNAKFTIDGNVLKSNEIFDFETKNSYTILVKSVDAGGNMFFREFTIRVMNVVETGIADVKLQYNLNIYPNPTSDFVTISGSMKTNATAKLSLMDAFGRTIQQLETVRGDWKLNVDMTTLARGMYYIHIESEGSRHSIPVIRN